MLAPHKSHSLVSSLFAAQAATAVLLLSIMMLVRIGSAAAVSEQALGATTPRHAPITPAAPPTHEPPALSQPTEAEPSQPPPVQLSVANVAKSFQSHASFPYTIRSGDTLGSIAAQFSIPIGDLTRINRLNDQAELEVGKLLRIPNPSVAHERELAAAIDQLERDKQDATDRAAKAESSLSSARAKLQALTAERRDLDRDVRSLAWWRGATYVLAGAAILLLGAMLLAVVDWWMLRSRFRAVAEMNESLRRLDYKYKNALAKAELRLQELYGRRRRGLHDGSERPKLVEEAEIEALARELKSVLEHHLKRIGPAGAGAQRAQWRERIARVGAPGEPRPVRR